MTDTSALPSADVSYSVSGGVATILLDRPSSMNSLGVDAKVGLLAALESARDDDSVRAVVLSGAGRAFCVGQDLREHADALDAGVGVEDTVRRHYNPIVLALSTMPKPVVACVNGMAAGAGASLALACDFRVMASSAQFLMAFARVGLGADSGASWTLPRLVGHARATALLMLAEPITAELALEMGMVNAVVADDKALDTATALALKLASGATAAYAAIKAQLAYSASHDLAESLEHEAVQQSIVGATADHLSATTAFLAKEKAVFTGR